MAEKLKQTLPLALAFGVLAFGWIEIALNFSFRWNSNGDLGSGLGLPANLHLVAPAAFVTWGLVFASGATPLPWRRRRSRRSLVLSRASCSWRLALPPRNSRTSGASLSGSASSAGTTRRPRWRHSPPGVLVDRDGPRRLGGEGGGVGSGLKSLADPAAAGTGRSVACSPRRTSGSG
jgi:hypothetical protein